MNNNEHFEAMKNEFASHGLTLNDHSPDGRRSYWLWWPSGGGAGYVVNMSASWEKSYPRLRGILGFVKAQDAEVSKVCDRLFNGDDR